MLDLRNGSLRDAAERPIKCWDRPAMLRGGPTPRDGHRAGVRWRGAGMYFHPTIGSLTRRDQNGGLATRCRGASRQPYRHLLDIAPNDGLTPRCSGASRQLTAHAIMSLVTTSPQTLFESRAAAAPQKTGAPSPEWQNADVRLHCRFCEHTGREAHVHRHSLRSNNSHSQRAASSKRCSEEHPTATSHLWPQDL